MDENRDGIRGEFAAAPTRAGWGAVALFALAYGLAAWAGLRFLVDAACLPIVWPAGGLALAALLRAAAPDRVRLLIAIGAAGLPAHLLACGQPLPAALAFALTGVLGALGGAWIFGRIAGRHTGRGTLRETQGLFAAASAAAVVSGLFATAVFRLFSGTPGGEGWWTASLANALGVLLVVPLLLAWTAPPEAEGTNRPRREEGAAIGLLALASLLAIFRVWPVEVPVLNHPHLLFLLVAGTGLRFGPRAVSSLVVASAFLFAGNLALGAPVNPFRDSAFWGHLLQTTTPLQTQFFLLLLSATGLASSAWGSANRATEKLLLRERARLRDSEARYRELVDQASDIVFSTDYGGRFTFVNPAGLRLIGYSLEELRKRQYLDLIRADRREEAVRFFARQFAERTETTHSEYPVITKEGREVWLEQNTKLLTKGDRVAGFQAMARDVSDRRRIEQELKRSRNVAERLAQEIEIIAGIGKLIGSTLAIGEVYERFAAEVRKLIPFDRLSINLHDPGRGLATVVYAAGEAVDGRMPGDSYPLAGSLGEVLIRTRAGLLRHPQGIPEVDRYYPGTSVTVQAGIRSLLSVPLIARGEVIAGLHFRSRRANVYTAQDLRLAERIGEQVAGAIANARLYAELSEAEQAVKQSERRYRELSMVDELTNLYNHRHFQAQLKSETERANRYGQPLALLLLDIDDFKAFNDTHGHVAGDRVLSRLGQVVRRCLRETDSAYRYGGEEFTVLLPMTTAAEGVVTAERIRAEFSREAFAPAPGSAAPVTLSIGVAEYRPQEETGSFVHRVDQLMYRGKRNGKDRVCSEPGAIAAERPAVGEDAVGR